jgi:arylsulfatase A-like enzyme
MKKHSLFLFTALGCASAGMAPTSAFADQRPNILWILAEDASPHIGPYGETLIATPALDRLAREGITFTRAFTTAPVCSPSRSALISGMIQTTLASHNHESNFPTRAIGGDASFYPSYQLPAEIKILPELFADAGYYVTNGDLNGNPGKTDYNFNARGGLYAGADWTGRAAGQPFFAQIQLQGGKGGNEPEKHPTDPTKVTLPPFLPDHPVLRKYWAQYLDDWKATDRQVGAILARLEKEGILEHTVVFFMTDHGITHVRGKQFLYDDGLQIPLLVRLPGGNDANTRRTDLVCHLDIAATSLDLAGIAIPEYTQGRALFRADYEPRQAVIGARDRCDETVDLIRTVRTRRFRYIRNFMSYRSHMQPNQYKDREPITKVMRKLYAAGQLNEIQARIFLPTRPTEELYDLENDPFELVNLALDRKFDPIRNQLRNQLYETMIEQRDDGMIPEPILDEMGLAAGSQYGVLLRPENRDLVRTIIATIEAGERRDTKTLYAALASAASAVRYWATVWVGQLRDASAQPALVERLHDDCGAVRVAAAEALYPLGDRQPALAELKRALNDRNHNTAFYAVRAWESIEAPVTEFLPLVRQSRHADYDYIQRIARRLASHARHKSGLRPTSSVKKP